MAWPVNRWARLNRRHRREVDGQPAPSRNDEYLFYQSLVGIWPLAAPHGKDIRDAGRPSGGLHGEGHARGQGLHELDQSRLGIRRRGPRVRRRRAGRAPQKPLLGRVPAFSRADCQLESFRRARRRRSSSSPRRACPTCTRDRSYGISASSIRTTAGRSISPNGGRCSRGSAKTSAATGGRCSPWPGNWPSTRAIRGSSCWSRGACSSFAANMPSCSGLASMSPWRCKGAGGTLVCLREDVAIGVGSGAEGRRGRRAAAVCPIDATFERRFAPAAAPGSRRLGRHADPRQQRGVVHA